MAVTAPQTEIGYAQAVNYNWWLYDAETTPELVWPQSIFVYDQMRRTDSQVTSVLRAMTLPVRQTPWRIDPNGAADEVVQLVADDLGLPVVGQRPTAPPRSKDRFSWLEHLRLALLMLPFGHSIFEQVYRVGEDGSRAHLHKLGWRPPKTIERIEVAPDGGLVYIKQYWTRVDEEPKPIPVDRLVAYVHEREGGNWLGTSILRPAYKNWLLKDRLLRVQAQTIERNGMGVPLYKGAEGEADLANGFAMAKAWRSGETAGTAVPFGADMVLRGVEGDLPDADPAIRYHDEQIGRAVLAHFLNLGTQTGSWALGTTFADFFTLSLQTLAQQIADTATQHVIEDLVDVNFGESEPAPRLVFDEIGSRQAATAAAIKTLVDAGVIRPDQVLEDASRQQYGLPPADLSTANEEPQAEPAPVLAAGDGGPKGEAAPAADPLPVTARFDPDQPRNPHTGEWIDVPGAREIAHRIGDLIDDLDDEDFVELRDPVVIAKQKAGREYHVRAVDDPDGTLLSINLSGDSARYVEVVEDARYSIGEGEFYSPSEAHAIADEVEAVAARARSATPPPRSSEHEHEGPVLLASGRAGDYPIAVYYDTYGDLQGEGSRFLVIGGRGEPSANWDEGRLRPDLDDVRAFVAALRKMADAAGAPPVTASTRAVTARFDPGQPRVPGGEHGGGLAWGDVHYSVVLGDPTEGPELWIGVWPKGAPDDWGASRDWQASFDLAEARKLLRQLARMTAAAPSPVQADAAFESLHKRDSHGKFATMAERLIHALTKHRESGGKGDPFAGFDREQLRRVAVKRPGIRLRRGASRDEIAKALVVDLGGHHAPDLPTPPAKKTAKKASPKPSKPDSGPAGRIAGLRAMSRTDARDALDDMTRPEVYELVQHLGERGQSKTRKRELVDLVLTHHSPAGQRSDALESPDVRVAELRARLDEIEAEAKPIADAFALRLESTRVPSHNETVENYRQLERLKKLREEGSALARQLLDALTDDGSHWGGDADAEADRWLDAGATSTVGRATKLSPDELQRRRDRYVITDRNTIIQNASLRSGRPTPAAKTWARKMREMVQSAGLGQDTKLHRGAALRPEDVARLRPGTVLHDSGIVSTAATASEAETYADERLYRMPGTIKTMFEIRAPRGTSAIDVGYGEIVLDHGNDYRIVASRIDADGVAYIVIELVGGTS